MPPSLSKFCDLRKQQIAPSALHSLGMPERSLNQVLADSLATLMEGKWNNSTLGRAAGLSANTIANYLAAKEPDFTGTGKERSATLTNLEKLAAPLRIHPVLLLLTPAERAALALQALKMVTDQAVTTGSASARLEFAFSGDSAQAAPPAPIPPR